MEKIRLGRTGLMVTRSSFGALPIQRLDMEGAKKLLRAAYDAGINFFDTARAYTDSEEKIGEALSDVRKDIVISSKTMSKTAAGLDKDLETSLRYLKTDYIDIYQFHNPQFIPDEGHELYQAAKKAKEAGKIRFISVTNHALKRAKEMVPTGLFDTMQFPLSALSGEDELELSALCRQHDVGLIAMKGLCGGLITDPTASFALLRSYGNIVPIWGIQKLEELEQFIQLEKKPPVLDDVMREGIERDRRELGSSFCRGCGYCVPTCPAKITINVAARMSLFLKRTNPALMTTPEQRAGMDKVKDCIDCGICRTHCPYNLDTPVLLRREYAYYQQYLKENNIG